ncbi:hypothetical protein [Cylindrospermopsis curvispora]|uniref:Uncharacterized protein n=1 Tax=Cylindrospermopsis curvispora GIHE-G1 TaxID=2666332 RepID=A0A7H0F1N9_9CYAN|nr:hypothetical protein [Cylindrospermopsis curvispora]QNP29955.1 hypothetical protein IAR63_02350 [Cylindrospermopsis curvispora GIHE-G1]
MQQPVSDRVRVVSAQGPAQLLNVLGILKYQLRNEANEYWEDHLVLGGFYIQGSDENLARMKEVCINISKYWNFKSVKYLSDDDLSISSSFFEVVESVKQKLNIGFFERIYVCRNWQPFNEILLECCPSAVKVCYGDGFGILDIKGATDHQPSINPRGYWKLNQAYIFAPVEIESKCFSLVDDFIQPPIDYLISIINDIASNMTQLKTYAKSLTDNSEKKLTLVTTSNFTESSSVRPSLGWLWLLRVVSAANRRLLLLKINTLEKTLNLIQQRANSTLAQREALMYFNQVIRYSSINEFIIIKSHPRETLNQSSVLCHMLSQRGYEAAVIDKNFSHLPVEFFFNHLNFSKIISCSSSSSLTAKLILGIDRGRIFPFIDRDLRKRYLSSFYCSNDERFEKLWINLLDQAELKTFSPLRLLDY